MLDKNLIPDTSYHDLILRIGRKNLTAMAYSPMHDNSLVISTEPYPAESPSWLRGVEDVVYANPLLLCDFRRTAVVVDTAHVMVVPDEAANLSDAQRVLLFEGVYGSCSGKIVYEPAGLTGSAFLTEMDSDLLGFLHRTMPEAVVMSHLSALTRYFALRPARANATRMVANLREDAADVICTGGGRLLMANTFSFTHPDDAAYYILACRENLELNSVHDELQLTGHREMRERLMPLLRRYVSHVMPVIFPPEMFRAGKESMSAPFDVIAAAVVLSNHEKITWDNMRSHHQSIMNDGV